MKIKLSTILIMVMIHLSSVMGAIASTGIREDNSMVLVYCFLAVCGTIIFLQIVPLLVIGYGMIKAVFGKREVSQIK